MKAITSDVAGEEIVGWAYWTFAVFEHHFSGEEEGVVQAADESKKLEASLDNDQGEQGEPNLETRKEKTKIEELEQITNASMSEWQAKLMPPGTKYLILVAIAVLPEFQGKGVGSKLIDWGNPDCG